MCSNVSEAFTSRHKQMIFVITWGNKYNYMIFFYTMTWYAGTMARTSLKHTHFINYI